MAEPDPLDIDFAQLRTLRAVYRLNSFSAAAEELGLSQSSVSYAIDRLRRAFRDPLFVRQGGGIAPTDRCQSIVATASEILLGLERIAQPAAFDPAASRDRLTISCNAYERLVLIPPLVRLMRQEAPGLKLDILTAQTHGNRHLLDGEADLVVSPVEVRESGIYSEPLISDRYVCLAARKTAPRKALAIADYLAAQHVVVTYGGTWKSPYLHAVEAAGHSLNVTVRTPSPGDLPALLHGTDLIATVPGRLGQVFADRVAVMDCPFPAPFDIRLFWAARSNGSGLVTWLRSALHRVAGALASPE